MILTIWFLHFTKGVKINLLIDEGEGRWWFDYSILKSSASAAIFTEGNHDYNNDHTIILASVITLNELHEEKKKIINAINIEYLNDFCSEYDYFLLLIFS